MEPKCFHNGKMSAGISPSDVIHLCEGTKKLQFLPLPTPRMSEIMTETCRRRNSLSVSRKCSISSKSLRKISKSQLRYKKSLYICSAKNLNVLVETMLVAFQHLLPTDCFGDTTHRSVVSFFLSLW